MTKINTIILVIILTWLCSTVPAQDECCSQHSNVCGDKCCDGTPLSEQCGSLKIIYLPPASAPQLTTSPQKDLPKNTPKDKPPPQRLYVWTDPNTEVTYFSNTFPPWYRNTLYPDLDKYPRIQVFDEYNRIIDDTGKQDSNVNAEQLRQDAETLQQQQEADRQAKKKVEEEKAKQVRFNKMFQEWTKTGTVSEEMKQILADNVLEGKVSLAMTEDQVKQILGEPQTTQTMPLGEKLQTILTYPNGKVVTLLGGRVISSLTKKP